MSSCEFCEISKDTFFTEHVRTTASVNLSPEFMLESAPDLQRLKVARPDNIENLKLGYLNINNFSNKLIDSRKYESLKTAWS